MAIEKKTTVKAPAKKAAPVAKKAAAPATTGTSAEARNGLQKRGTMTGIVVSDKMQKTISVLIYRLVKHKKYGKFMRRSSVFKAHDENNTAKIGDTVRIHQTRPMSKTKRWALSEVVKAATVTAGVKE